MPARPALSPAQVRLLERWLPGHEVVTDHSWGLVDTVVLQVRHEGRDLVVKAGGEGNHHLRREITARHRWTGPWLRSGSVGALLHASEERSVLVVEHLPGQLVQDVPAAAGDPETYRQAGRLLSVLHAQGSVPGEGYEAAADEKVLWWLALGHRIPPSAERRIRAVIATHEHEDVPLVPTHGDWHPRNWLVDDDGTVRVIDLGRADLRPPATDLARLARQQWEGRPDLEEAFLDGYGPDPRRPAAWRATLLREAVGTAVWAHQVGDVAFEQQGHRMIARALELYR